MNFCTGDMIVFSGNSNPKLAKAVCQDLGVPLGQMESTQFSDGEISINIGETVRGKDVYVIQPTSSPVNDHLMELLIIIDALRRASAGRINAVVPYYGYARQDRKTKAREPITSKLVADLITQAGADRVITMDLHAGQIQGYFNIPVDHLSAISHLADYFHEFLGEDACVVSPDLGGVTRARNFATRLDLPIAIIEKRRPKANESEVMNLIGDIEGKDCIIIDDIVDTAGTICKAAAVLKERGAKRVFGCATHGVLSGPALERIEDSVMDRFVITNTIYKDPASLPEKITVVSVASLLAECIRRVNTNLSISQVFDR